MFSVIQSHKQLLTTLNAKSSDLAAWRAKGASVSGVTPIHSIEEACSVYTDDSEESHRKDGKGPRHGNCFAACVHHAASPGHRGFASGVEPWSPTNQVLPSFPATRQHYMFADRMIRAFDV